eukprot:2885106-Pyramimonas_sp.AAC.1
MDMTHVGAYEGVNFNIDAPQRGIGDCAGIVPLRAVAFAARRTFASCTFITAHARRVWAAALDAAARQMQAQRLAVVAAVLVILVASGGLASPPGSV